MNTPFFVLGILSLVTIVGVVITRQVLTTARAKAIAMAENARGEAYRKLAEEAISVQQKTSENLAELRIRITSMEKMLREVE